MSMIFVVPRLIRLDELRFPGCPPIDTELRSRNTIRDSRSLWINCLSRTRDIKIARQQEGQQPGEPHIS